MRLDPASDTYETQTQEIADRVAEMAHDQALLMANVFKQVSEILTDEQREELEPQLCRRGTAFRTGVGGERVSSSHDWDMAL